MSRVMLISRRLSNLIPIAVILFGLIEGSHEVPPTVDCNMSLNLTAVGLKSLPHGFVKNNFMTHLILDDNEISSITSEAFSSVSKLTYLSLARNKLTTLALNAFSELNSLDTLVLNGNCKAQPVRVNPSIYLDEYEYYDNFSPRKTENLVYALDDSCRLKFDGYLRSLIHLFAESNDIKKLVFNSGELPVLTHLYLSHNPLEINQGSLSGLNAVAPALTHLYLQHCEIPKIDLLQLPTITSLYLDDNKIESICNKRCKDSSLKLNEARKLEILSVSYNQISEVGSDSFIHTTNLLSLDLSNNKITNIREGTFDNLYSLKFLSLERNKLVQLSAVGTFKDLINLETLSLGGNDISNVSTGIFKSLSSLKRLTLNSTKISSIDSEMFANLSSLEVLSLADNHLSTIPDGTFQTSGSLITLNLDNNNFVNTDDISLTDKPRMLSLSLWNNPLKKITAQWIARIGSENLTISLSDCSPSS